MLCLRRIYTYHYYISGYHKNVLLGRTNWITLLKLQTCGNTRKSAEEMLGIEKPKRPLNPFFKFMSQMKPTLSAKIPGISSKDVTVWSSKHWQLVDHKTKLQMKKEYENEFENYIKQKIIYEASLTEVQKRDIKRVNEQITSARKKRKLKSEFKEMGKPKKPMSSYLLYTQSRNDKFQSKQLKEYQGQIKAGWLNLSKNERAKFNKEARDLMKKYKKDMESWELKMISMGHLHLVRQKPPKKRKAKNDKNIL